MTAAVYDKIWYAGLSGEWQGLAGWLLAFRESSLPAVRARLCDDRLLRQVPSRRSWGPTQSRAPVYRATDARTGALPWALLSNRLFRREPLGLSGAFLVGVAQATRLRDRLLLEGASPAVRIHAERAVAALPDLLGLLVAQTAAAISRGAPRRTAAE